MDNTQLTIDSNITVPEFQPWGKTHRLNRLTVVTEKLDGSNAQIYITDEGELFAGSRNRWVLPGKDTDHCGFASWAYAHKDELVEGLGVGRHYGEWFGRKIQRGYDLKTKYFALFNTSRWFDPNVGMMYADAAELAKYLPHRTLVPACCTVVPVLALMTQFDSTVVDDCLRELEASGSVMVPGYMGAEGLIVYHTASEVMHKVTIADDASPKSLVGVDGYKFRF